jgi:hypothetical protein
MLTWFTENFPQIKVFFCSFRMFYSVFLTNKTEYTDFPDYNRLQDDAGEPCTSTGKSTLC